MSIPYAVGESVPCPFAYNSLWRLDMVINPAFHCDTASMAHAFPSLIPRRMAGCIGEI
jgi:hypothetical protein